MSVVDASTFAPFSARVRSAIPARSRRASPSSTRRPVATARAEAEAEAGGEGSTSSTTPRTAGRRAGLAAEPYLEATMLADIDGGGENGAGARGGRKAGSRREDGVAATSPAEEEGYLHGADDDADGEFYMDEEVRSDDDDGA